MEPSCPAGEVSPSPFRELLSLLQKSFGHFESSSRGEVIGTDDSGSVAYFNVGLRAGPSSGVCSLSHSLPGPVKELNSLLLRIFPQATWASICINHNGFAKLHADSGNLLPSRNHVVAAGDFTGGELWLQGSPNGTPCPAPEPEISFDPGLIHGSIPWVRDRWVIAAYTPGFFPRAPDTHLAAARSPTQANSTLSVPLAGPQSPALPLPQGTSAVVPMPRCRIH